MASRGGGGAAIVAAAAIAAAVAEELRAMANGGHHKTVLITGVGRGLGRALAIEMARRGHTVFGFSRDFYDLESLGLILYSDPDHRHVLFHLDVRDDEAVSHFAHKAIDLVGVPDIIELGPKFMKEKGLEHVAFSTADGALEAAPTMGTTDAILDLVSSGTTLRENNLKELEGGIVLESKVVLVASKRAVIERSAVLTTTHEILERLEAHLGALGQFTVTANMKDRSVEEVAERILSQPSLSGLQGPTISPVFCKRDGKVIVDYYAIVICVPKKDLYTSVQQLRGIGGSGVLVSPLTYIFDAELPRWADFLTRLGL